MFGKRMRERRIELGLSREHVAAYTGVVLATVANWERGDTIPNVGHAKRVARLLGTTVDDLAAEAE